MHIAEGIVNFKYPCRTMKMYLLYILHYNIVYIKLYSYLILFDKWICLNNYGEKTKQIRGGEN
jgi:hypothetical protein